MMRRRWPAFSLVCAQVQARATVEKFMLMLLPGF